MPIISLLLLTMFSVVSLVSAQSSQVPQWIWGPKEAGYSLAAAEYGAFRATLQLASKPKSATLHFTADNHFIAWVNGKRVLRSDSWESPVSASITAELQAGTNEFVILAWNDGGPAGVIGQCILDSKVALRTGPEWRVSPKRRPGNLQRPKYDEGTWLKARVIGPAGVQPWGRIAWESAPQLNPLPGFKVSEIASGCGSLICLTGDTSGHLFASVERGGIVRLSDQDGDGTFEHKELFTAAIKNAQGLLSTDRFLFVVGKAKDGLGLFRIAHDDPQRIPERLLRIKGNGGEHGPHAVTLGPDGLLYLAIGNHVSVEGLSPASGQIPDYEGHLTPLIKDPRGHANHVRAPGGQVVVCDQSGQSLRRFAVGFRNHFDLAFDSGGNLFTYDSDMEWDIGLPWYRPVRVLHVVDGADYGWRTGSAKWPRWAPDSLPAAINVGRGSPCGMVSYNHHRFPPRFHGAIFGADWSQGQILAFHLKPKGSTFTGTSEVLISGRPLNVTDLWVDTEGDLLFSTGGRGTRGAIYRLSADKDPSAPQPAKASVARAPEPGTTIGDCFRQIAEGDRWLRYRAARVLEGMPASKWLNQALAHSEPTVRAEALLILARKLQADPKPQAFLSAWQRAEATTLLDGEESVAIALLRSLELAAIAKAPIRDDLQQRLLALYPTRKQSIDRSLVTLLAHLFPRGTAKRLLDELEAENSADEQIHIVYALSEQAARLNKAERQRVLTWFAKAASLSGGDSFAGFLKTIRATYMKPLAEEEKAQWTSTWKRFQPKAGAIALEVGAPKRDIDRSYALVDRLLKTNRRSASEGALIYQQSCVACHRFGSLGGSGGPDLTTVSARLGLRDLMTTIMDPSRVISDQYRALDVWLRDDSLVSGLPIEDSAGGLVLRQGDGTTVRIDPQEIDTRRFSKVSGMPEGLLDGLSPEQIADLIAFLTSTHTPPVPKASGWRPLLKADSIDTFNGDPTLWSMKGNTLVGIAKNLPSSSFLVSKESFSDFVLEFEIMLAEGNSGLQFRSKLIAPYVLAGYQADAGQVYWGSLFEERGRGMLHHAPRSDWSPYLTKAGYNHYVVSAIGERITIEVNGIITTDLHDAKTASGRIGFQLHSGKGTAVSIRNLRILMK